MSELDMKFARLIVTKVYNPSSRAAASESIFWWKSRESQMENSPKSSVLLLNHMTIKLNISVKNKIERHLES